MTNLTWFLHRAKLSFTDLQFSSYLVGTNTTSAISTGLFFDKRWAVETFHGFASLFECYNNAALMHAKAVGHVISACHKLVPMTVSVHVPVVSISRGEVLLFPCLFMDCIGPIISEGIAVIEKPEYDYALVVVDKFSIMLQSSMSIGRMICWIFFG